MRRATRMRALLLVASASVSACGLLIGIDADLDVKAASVDSSTPETQGTNEAAADSSVAVDAAPAPPGRPPEGTYVYSAAGTEHLYGPLVNEQRSYTTVEVKIVHDDSGDGGDGGGGSCFVMSLTFRPDYVETMHMCIRDRVYVQDTGTRNQIFGVTTVATVSKCAPGDVYFTTAPKPPVETHYCTGMNQDGKTANSAFATGGLYTYGGDVTLSVMGKDVLTRYFKDERTVSGKQTGTNDAGWYFSPDDGTLQHLERTVHVTYPSPIGVFTYEESVVMTLVERRAPADAGTD